MTTRRTLSQPDNDENPSRRFSSDGFFFLFIPSSFIYTSFEDGPPGLIILIQPIY